MILIALQRFEYGRRSLMPGDRFEASEFDARLLIGGLGPQKAMAAPKTETEPVPSRRSQKRETA